MICARALDVVARCFGGVLGGCERFLALLQFGDVAVHRDPPPSAAG